MHPCAGTEEVQTYWEVSMLLGRSLPRYFLRKIYSLLSTKYIPIVCVKVLINLRRILNIKYFIHV